VNTNSCCRGLLPATNRDLWISLIRLSDKTSRLHPRHVVPKPAQAYEPEVRLLKSVARRIVDRRTASIRCSARMSGKDGVTARP
jgi:hypothetical protein